ncbi:TetR/AcrR family transcriptional regulator [Microbacterium proteolyticum]|uniref:TetR/AcrR family transcriptional regulator n=1 Tax=Microbacterium proteolyticum TaxID=1572644 RepID=UPI0024163472|nr:TetR/AcrR family transcriptional regulator [Microbacterium proteolyticum]
MSTSARSYHHGDLRTRLLDVAEELLEEGGVGALSLREVARRADVSHNAPYRHFASKDELLAALAASGFDGLAASRADISDPRNALVESGLAYVRFALEHRALFRLMFSGAAGGESGESVASEASAAAMMRGAFGDDTPGDALISSWSFVHGLAGLLLDDQVPAGLRVGRDDETLARDVLTLTARALDAGLADTP